MTRRTRNSDGRKLFASVLLVSLAWQTLPLTPAFAAKTKPLSVPVYAQLTEGAGPETHDAGSVDGAAGGATEKSDSNEKTAKVSAVAPDLSPVRLDTPVSAQASSKTEESGTKTEATTEAANTSSAAAEGTTASASVSTRSNATAADASADGTGSQVLNATVNRDEFVPKAPVDRTDLVVGEPVQKDSKKEKTDKQAKELGRKLGPVMLQESDSEVKKKTLTVVDAEKAEMADLWDAALSRNQDIQFVVQKLMPAKDPKHTTAMMMKLLSTAMYGAMSASSMMMPGGASAGQMQGMYMAQNAGAGLVMNVLNGAASKSARKAQVTETEAIMLYNIIRNVAEKVVENFHEYKKNRTSVDRGYADYQDLQNMVADARSGQDPSKQIEMEYTLRKARRDIDAINDDVRRCRQALVDLAGSESVEKLDKQIAIENDNLQEGTNIADPAAGDATATEHGPASAGKEVDEQKKDPTM